MSYGYDDADEFAVLRGRLDALEREAGRRAGDGLGRVARTLVGRVFDGGSMPTEVPGFFKVRPVVLDGAEAIGGAVTATDSSWDEAVVLVLGPEVPGAGDVVVAKLIQGYWVAQKGGGEEATTGLLTVTYNDCSGAYPGLPVKVYAAIPNAAGRYLKGSLVTSGTTNGSGVYLPNVPVGHYWVEPDPTTNYWPDAFGTYVPTSGTIAPTSNISPRAHWTCAGCCDGTEGPEGSDSWTIAGMGATWDYSRHPNATVPNDACATASDLNAVSDCVLTTPASTGILAARFICGTSTDILSFVAPLCGTGTRIKATTSCAEAQAGSAVGYNISATGTTCTDGGNGTFSFRFTTFTPNPISPLPVMSLSDQDFTVTSAEPADVGRVLPVTVQVRTNDSATAVAGASIEILDYDSGTSYGTFTADGSGSYTGSIATSTRRVRAYATATSGCQVGQTGPLVCAGDMGASINLFTVNIGSPMTVNVTLTKCEDGTPHAGVSVWATGPLSTLSPPFHRASGTTDSSGQVSLAVWADNDFVVTHGVISGRDTLTATVSKSCTTPVAVGFSTYPTSRPITVAVTSSVTGLPVSGVTFKRQGFTQGTTNAAGNFVFNMPYSATTFGPETWELSKTGWVTQSWSQTLNLSCGAITVPRSLVPV